MKDNLLNVREAREIEREARESERSQRESERQGRERLIDTVRHTRRSRGRHLERGRRGGARNCSYVHGRYSTQGRSAERGPGDLDDEYMALVNDGEWVEVTRGRNKNKLLNRTHPHPINQHRATIKGSWRDKADVTTFYFSRFPELSCLICSMVGAGRGIDGIALSITHLSGRVTSSHFIFLGRETLAFVISVINKVVSPF